MSLSFLRSDSSPSSILPRRTSARRSYSRRFISRLGFLFNREKIMSNTTPATAASSSKSKATGICQPQEKRQPLFQKELQHMMYGFGDEQNTHKTQEIGSKRGRLLIGDFLYLISKGMPKLNRCRELLAMQEELKQARKAFDVDEDLKQSLWQ